MTSAFFGQQLLFESLESPLAFQNIPDLRKVRQQDSDLDRKPSASARLLKIEEAGDSWKGAIKPKIRLMGRWLEQAGFKPGNHVQVTCLAPGIIELRAPASSPGHAVTEMSSGDFHFQQG